MRDEEQARMPDGSEFQTGGGGGTDVETAGGKCCGTDNRLVFEEHRERAGRDVVAKKRAELSWLRGADTVMSPCGKFPLNALVDGASNYAEGWQMNGCHDVSSKNHGGYSLFPHCKTTRVVRLT